MRGTGRANAPVSGAQSRGRGGGMRR
jgi:hypothetical protein